MPKVSVVTPVYNGALFIENNIRSVMSQTYQDFEHIIVNDCSTDNTAEIVKRYPQVRLIELDQNGGPARALNIGYKQATGSLFSWVSADDGYLPTYLEKAVAHLDQNPKVVCVDSGAHFVDIEGFVLKTERAHARTKVTPGQLLRSNPIFGSSTTFRREVYFELEGFNEDLIGTPDTDMWIRMLKLGEIGHIPEAITYSTRHPNQDSRKRSHLVTENQKWLALETVKRFGVASIVPEDWSGPRDTAQAEAAGWYALARAHAGTSDNALVSDYVAKAWSLNPANRTYRISGALLPIFGNIKFKLRGKLAPIAMKILSEKSRRMGLNVHKINRDHLIETHLQIAEVA